MNEIKINEIQMNILKKIEIKAANHAANALSKMIGHKININLINIKLIKLEEVPYVPENNEEQVVGIYFKLLEEIKGLSLIMFPKKSALSFIDIFSDKKFESIGIMESEFKKSILMEIGNITLGAFLTIISAKTGIIIIGSIPYIAEDTMGSLFNSSIAEIGLLSESTLMTEMEFIDGSKTLKGWLYLFSDFKSLGKIINTLGKIK